MILSLIVLQGCNILFTFIPNSVMQGVLHWVAAPSDGVDPLKVEVRLFDKLFLKEVSDTLYPRLL